MQFIFILTFLYVYGFQQTELKCLSSYHDCGKSEPYQCIPNDWVCDYNSDCEDGSDEAGCPTVSCKSTEFHCRNSDQCIKKTQICDGIKDCIDNSDEVHCSNVKKSCDERIQYDCKNGIISECISLDNVCNRKINCSNGMNLKEDCNKDLCKNSHNGSSCSHICINKYSSFLCDCPKGMILGKDDRTCKKINICYENPDICTQECHLTSEGYSCSCFEGYIKVGNKCILNNYDATVNLLFSSLDGIYAVTLLTDISETLKTSNKLLPVPNKLVTFDAKINNKDLEIYSSYVDYEAILSVDILSGWSTNLNVHTRQNEGSQNLTLTASFYSIAADPARNLVFWTDTNASTISVFNISSMDKYDIIVKDCFYPISLVLNPITAKLFWIELGNGVTGPRIMMSNMDGTDRKVLILTGLRKPTSLALDIDNELLYWNDLYPGSIKYLDLKLYTNENNKINVLFESYDFFPVSMALYKNRVYWSDWHQSRIYSVHKISGKGLFTVVEGIQTSTIRIISSMLTADIIKKTSSNCSTNNNPCQYSCLPSSFKNTVKCFGSLHMSQNHYKERSSAWWFIVIPIVLISFLSVALVKYHDFKKKNIRSVLLISTEGCNYDQVKFFEDNNEESANDTGVVNISDSLPILQTV